MAQSDVDFVAAIDSNETPRGCEDASEISTPRLELDAINLTEDELIPQIETPRSIPISDAELSPKTETLTPEPSPKPKDVPEKKPSTPTSAKKEPKARSNLLAKGKTSPNVMPKKAINSTSAIPVKISRPPSRLSVKPSKTGSLVARKIVRGVVNKHTLEVQYLNKHKRLLQYKKELVEKQKPVMELYQNLLEIKRQLADFGKIVELEEVKFVIGVDAGATATPVASNKSPVEADRSRGDGVSEEMVQSMRDSIETIPQTLMGVCQNLVSRRDAIVELLECVSQAEFDKTDLPERIVSLKDEGVELKRSLDLLIRESRERIAELVGNWHQLLEQRHSVAVGEGERIRELEQQLKHKEQLVADSRQLIVDLQKKLDEKRQVHEQAVSEFEIAVKQYTDNIKKITQELENEKKSFAEIKTRNQGNAQTIKTLKSRLTESEKTLKETETKNGDLSKKLKLVQEQLKQKESLWSKEREELLKNISGQEKLLQKLTEDRNHFQMRVEGDTKKHKSTESGLQNQVKNLQSELDELKDELQKTKVERDEFKEKVEGFEKQFNDITTKENDKLQAISNQMDWGNTTASADVQAELYSELLATKVTLREYEEKLRLLERDSQKWNDEKEELNEKLSTMMLTPDLCKQEEIINKYKELLQESERRLSEKSVEVAKLNAELRHLKLRQDALEEQNLNCPTDELRKMVSDGRQKLTEIMKKSMENEQKLAHYEATIEKQHKQMNEMENLLRVRDGLIGMIKAKKDELIMEKDSLTRYCKDVRNMLAETREDLRCKSDIMRDLQEKLDKKDKTCAMMEKKIRELEENLAYTNEKRFKLQDTIGSMEKELQSTKAHANQLAEMHQQQSRYDLGMPKFSNRDFIPKTSAGESAITLVNATTLDELTVHQHAELNLELPIREMETIRKRLYKLSQLQLPVPLHDQRLRSNVRTGESLCTLGSQGAYKKMIEIEKRRYELLQRQTDQSYENLSYLLRLSMPERDATSRRDFDARSLASQRRSPSLVATVGDSTRFLDRSDSEPISVSVDDRRPHLNAASPWRYNKVYLSTLSDTYRDLNESLRAIKRTLKDESRLSATSVTILPD